MTPPEQFREAIYKQLGVAPAVIVGDGKTHRFSINGKKRDDAGEYRFYDDKFPAGFAKDYRHGIYLKWSARDDATPFSESDRAEYARIKRDREERRQREQAESARLAQERWRKAEAANPAHPYLAHKGVQAHGLRQDGDMLLVPVIDGEEIISVQTIAPDGSKLFQLDSRVKGGCFVIGDASDTIYLVEGYATGATIHELTGGQIIVAFNAGNLLAVAPKIRAAHPDANIVICADDDFAVDPKGGS
jgi:putative DNA primase/helicase